MAKNVVWDGSTDIRMSCNVKFDKIMDRTAKRCANHLTATSPEGLRTGRKYKYGWTIRKGKQTNNETFIEVWNKTDWQLTWLLENGHIIANKKGGVGWASAKPHIQMAIDYVRPQFISEMEQAEIEIDFEKG